MPVTTIKPYSNAYFDVMDKLPELRAVFALGGKCDRRGTRSRDRRGRRRCVAI